MGKRSDGTPGKKRPAPSASKRPARDLTALIARELYVALERVCADEELLAIVGSWRDTLSDAEVAAAGIQRDRESAASSAITLRLSQLEQLGRKSE
jgi:hypothetical protein